MTKTLAQQRAEITKLYTDHLASLRLSGLEFDEASVRAEWAKALAAFDEAHQ